MNKTFALALILALGAPAAAEPAAPELPFIDAAVVRAQPFRKENINIGAAFPGMQACKFTGVQGDTCSFACKDGSVVKRPRLNSTVAQNGGCPTMVMVPAAGPKGLFDGPAITKVEDADYICQGSGGGYAIRSAGRSSRIWQLDGAGSGAVEGLELSKVFIDGSGLPRSLKAEGHLSFPGQELKVGLSLRQDPKNGGEMSMTVSVDGEATPLKNVPCVSAGADKSRAAAQVYAEGRLFSYNRATRQFDLPTGRACSVTLKNFKSYNDTEHGTPRDVVSADYVLGGFSNLGNYVSGTAVGSAPEALAPYVSLQNYLPSGLSKGIDVKIFVDNVPSAQALLSRPVPPASVYVSKENSMSSYFGGDGIKWGYWCDLRGNR